MSATIREGSVVGLSLALAAGAAAASWPLVSLRFAVSLVFGAALGAANFHALFAFWERALLRRERAGVLGSFAVRFALLGLLVWAALAAGAQPVGLVTGLSLIMPAVVFVAWRARPAPATDALALAPDDPSWEAWDPWRARERDPDEIEDER